MGSQAEPGNQRTAEVFSRVFNFGFRHLDFIRHSSFLNRLPIQLGRNDIEAPQHGHDVADEVPFDEFGK